MEPAAFGRSSDAQLETLHGICHAFASTWNVDEAARAAVHWVRAAVQSPDASVRIFMLQGDALSPVVSEGTHAAPAGTNAMLRARRRSALASKRSAAVDLERASGLTLAILPLVCRGRAIGVLETIAPAARVHEHWRTLEAIASQAAIVFNNVRERGRLYEGLSAFKASSTLVEQLLRASGAADVVMTALDACHGYLRSPAAAWMVDGEGNLFELVGARGFDPDRTRRLQTELRVLPPGDLRGRGDRLSEALWDRPEEVEVVDVDRAIILVGRRDAVSSQFASIITPIVESALDRVGTDRLAELNREKLRLALAWAAHDLKGPVLGARITMELVASHGVSEEHQQLLARSRSELEALGALLDSIFALSAGESAFGFRRENLVEIVERAVDACCAEVGESRVVIDAPLELAVEADAPQLTSAIGNIVRNALVYTSDNGKVEVVVKREANVATVSVHDSGPGISAEETEVIFDPFVRGRAGGSAPGKGLGLFIARQVLDAHGGSIWVESSEGKTTFRIALPVTD